MEKNDDLAFKGFFLIFPQSNYYHDFGRSHACPALFYTEDALFAINLDEAWYMIVNYCLNYLIYCWNVLRENVYPSNISNLGEGEEVWIMCPFEKPLD